MTSWRNIFTGAELLPRAARAALQVSLAAAIITLFTLLLAPLRGFLSTSVVALLYVLAVVVCTTTGRVTAGISASFLGFLAFNYFFLPPLKTFTVTHTQDILALFVFLTVAVVISNLMGRAQTRLEQIRLRERESGRLFELSSSFTTTRDERQVAEVLARHLLESFQPDLVEVQIQTNLTAAECADRPCVQVRLPETGQAGAAQPHTQPLATSRGVLGEIRLWIKPAALSTGDQRLLQTFASQAALAVERALLSKSETRAKILEESDRLKTALLSSVSHELRTPLASIQAAASSLYDPSAALEPEAKREMQSLLLEETERLNQLVGNLLNMSRIEAGALKLQLQWNSLADLIDTAVERMQRQAARHTVEVEVSEDLPLVRVDALLIEQVFINLVSNSVKYAPAGSRIVIRAACPQPAWMQVTLTNQGPPIPEEHLEHIFEKFYRYPGMKQEGSTGLGLSICKGIVEAHGGRIWAANTPGGLAFSFTIPLEKNAPVVIPEEESLPGGYEDRRPGTAAAAKPDRPEEQEEEQGGLAA